MIMRHPETMWLLFYKIFVEYEGNLKVKGALCNKVAKFSGWCFRINLTSSGLRVLKISSIEVGKVQNSFQKSTSEAGTCFWCIKNAAFWYCSLLSVVPILLRWHRADSCKAKAGPNCDRSAWRAKPPKAHARASTRTCSKYVFAFIALIVATVSAPLAKDVQEGIAHFLEVLILVRLVCDE